MTRVLLALLVGLTLPVAQRGDVVAESLAEGRYGVAALQARLDWQHRYALQVDGPSGAAFTANYLQVYVGNQPERGQTGNEDGSFEGVMPYQSELQPPAAPLLFWRYSIVVSPQASGDTVVRVVDLGSR